MRPKAWWAVVTVLPLLRPFLYVYMRFTPLPAWVLTLLSFFSGVYGAWEFLNGRLVSGALLFQLSFFLDCADGAVARLKKKTSFIWGYIDFMLDRIKFFLLVIALTYNTFSILWCSAYLFLGLLYFLPWKFIEKIPLNRKYIPSEYYRYPTDVESQALAFIVFPLLNLPLMGIKVGTFILFFDQILFFSLLIRRLNEKKN